MSPFFWQFSANGQGWGGVGGSRNNKFAAVPSFFLPPLSPIMYFYHLYFFVPGVGRGVQLFGRIDSRRRGGDAARNFTSPLAASMFTRVHTMEQSNSRSSHVFCLIWGGRVPPATKCRHHYAQLVSRHKRKMFGKEFLRSQSGYGFVPPKSCPFLVSGELSYYNVKNTVLAKKPLRPLQ